MRRRTSTTPVRVYKYALGEPTDGSRDVVDEAFRRARVHYNQLVTIENVRRRKYREARARLFPACAEAEARVAVLAERLRQLRAEVSASKASARSRAVPGGAAEKISGTKAELSAEEKRLRRARRVVSRAEVVVEMDEVAARGESLEKLAGKLRRLDDVVAGPDDLGAARELRAVARAADEDAREAVKKLRPETYWGTYLLCEAAAQQAARTSPVDVAYDDVSAHLARGRVGVHFLRGLPVADLMTGGSNLVRFEGPPTWRSSATSKPRAVYPHDSDGRKVPCLLRFRVGSEGRGPVWGSFPAHLHRPLPADGVVKDAYVTRRPLRERNPWQYHLCLVVEAPSLERTLSGTRQEGTTSVNFGWRRLPDGSLRVATVNDAVRGIWHVTVPADRLGALAKTGSLRSILSRELDVVREMLAEWIAGRVRLAEEGVSEPLPEAFLESFRGVGSWRSQHRLCELARYWESRRVSGDDWIYPLVEAWRRKYLHLHDWAVNAERRFLRWRDDLYRQVAKKIATTSARLVVDLFEISEVARHPRPEEVEEGGRRARTNRQAAAPGELRSKILEACRTYHCEVVAADPSGHTRRCNVCGATYPWSPAREVVHACPGAGGEGCSEWDQDVNNTDNLTDAAASGEVVRLVEPARGLDGGQVCSSTLVPMSAAREDLRSSLKNQ